MPEVATHRYHPTVGPCLNICSLPDLQALQVLDRVRRNFRPTLKPDYLARRRTERWLSDAATEALGKPLEQRPAYFFLGDFSYAADASRPAALVIQLSKLPADGISFTLGDSMSVAEQANRKIYKLDEIAALFMAGQSIVADFGLSDRHGFQSSFIELQLWEPSWRIAHAP